MYVKYHQSPQIMKRFLFIVMIFIAYGGSCFAQDKTDTIGTVEDTLFDLLAFNKECMARMRTTPIVEIIESCSSVLNEHHLNAAVRSRLLSLRGYFYYNEQLYTLAYNDFKEAIKTAKGQENEPRTIAYCARTSVDIATKLGLFDQAMVFQNMALSVASRSDSVYILNNRAMIEQSYGTHEKALQTLNLALTMAGSAPFSDTLLVNKVHSFLRLGRLNDAKSVLNHFKRRNAALSNELKVSLGLHEANYLSLKHQTKEALKKYQAAEAMAQQAGLLNGPVKLEIDLGLAHQLFLLEEYEKNHEHLQQTIHGFTKGENRTIRPKLLELLSLSLQNGCAFDKATADDIDRTIQLVFLVVDNMQQNRMHASEKAHLARYLKQIMEHCYDFYAQRDVVLKGTHLRHFIQLSESVRAIQLKERMQTSQLGAMNNAFFLLQKEADQIQYNLATVELSPEEKLDLSLKLDDIRLKIEALNAVNVKADTTVKATASFFPDLSQLVYFVGEEGIFFLHRTNDFAKVRKVNSTPDHVENLVHQLNLAIDGRSDEYYPLSLELYQLLWPKSATGFNVSILPDQFLFRVPFEALVTTLDESFQFLIHQHSIQYAYTSHLHQPVGKTGTEVELSNNLFIHNSFQNSAAWSYIPMDKNPIHALDDYRCELQAQQPGLKKAFLDALETKDLVHLTSHGKFDDEAVLILFEGLDTLTIDEVANKKCGAQLVMMNACESALGKSDQVEGTLSFAYALQSAGCPNVSVNLWKSNATISQQLLSDFLTGLESTYLVTSLRKSKLDFLRDEETSLQMKHPYYWASPVLYGNTMVKMTLSKKSYNASYVVLLLLLFLFLVIVSLRLR